MRKHVLLSVLYLMMCSSRDFEKVLNGMSDEVQSICRKMEEVAPGLDMKDACTLRGTWIAMMDR